MGESELMNEFITLEKECQSLIDDLDEFYTSYPKVVGINKIKRKIKAEQNLMQSVSIFLSFYETYLLII